MLRVRKVERPRMEKEPVQPPAGLRFAVEGEIPVPSVARDGVPDRNQMPANLVRPARLDGAFQQGALSRLLQHPVAGAGFLHLDSMLFFGASGLLPLGQRELNCAARLG